MAREYYCFKNEDQIGPFSECSKMNGTECSTKLSRDPTREQQSQHRLQLRPSNNPTSQNLFESYSSNSSRCFNCYHEQDAGTFQQCYCTEKSIPVHEEHQPFLRPYQSNQYDGTYSNTVGYNMRPGENVRLKQSDFQYERLNKYDYHNVHGHHHFSSGNPTPSFKYHTKINEPPSQNHNFNLLELENNCDCHASNDIFSRNYQWSRPDDDNEPHDSGECNVAEAGQRQPLEMKSDCSMTALHELYHAKLSSYLRDIRKLQKSVKCLQTRIETDVQHVKESIDNDREMADNGAKNFQSSEVLDRVEGSERNIDYGVLIDVPIFNNNYCSTTNVNKETEGQGYSNCCKSLSVGLKEPQESLQHLDPQHIISKPGKVYFDIKKIKIPKKDNCNTHFKDMCKQSNSFTNSFSTKLLKTKRVHASSKSPRKIPKDGYSSYNNEERLNSGVQAIHCSNSYNVAGRFDLNVTKGYESSRYKRTEGGRQSLCGRHYEEESEMHDAEAYLDEIDLRLLPEDNTDRAACTVLSLQNCSNYSKNEPIYDAYRNICAKEKESKIKQDYKADRDGVIESMGEVETSATYNAHVNENDINKVLCGIVELTGVHSLNKFKKFNSNMRQNDVYLQTDAYKVSEYTFSRKYTACVNCKCSVAERNTRIFDGIDSASHPGSAYNMLLNSPEGAVSSSTCSGVTLQQMQFSSTDEDDLSTTVLRRSVCAPTPAASTGDSYGVPATGALSLSQPFLSTGKTAVRKKDSQTSNDKFPEDFKSFERNFDINFSGQSNVIYRLPDQNSFNVGANVYSTQTSMGLSELNALFQNSEDSFPVTKQTDKSTLSHLEVAESLLCTEKASVMKICEAVQFIPAFVWLYIYTTNELIKTHKKRIKQISQSLLSRGCFGIDIDLLLCESKDTPLSDTSLRELNPSEALRVGHSLRALHNLQQDKGKADWILKVLLQSYSGGTAVSGDVKCLVEEVLDELEKTNEQNKSDNSAEVVLDNR